MVFVRALGSCVAVTIYDPSIKVGGMAHVMLPDDSNVKNGHLPYQYANTAVDTLVENVCSKGANKFRLRAKIAGGSQLFDVNETLEKPVGEQNVEKVKAALRKASIRLEAEDTGGRRGRNVQFFLDSGKLVTAVIGEIPKNI